MSINKYFESGIEVERYTEGTDELGNPTKEWTHHLDIVGRIDLLTGDKSEQFQKPTVDATHMLFCPVLDITAKDRIKYQGTTYEVKYVDDPMHFGRFLQVYLEVKE